MWMKRCQDLVEDVKLLSSKLRLIHGSDSEFYLSRYDIDTFFPSIDCSALIPAVDFFVNDDKFRDGFWVHKRNKKWVFSKKPSLEDIYNSVQQLKMLVDHEIKNGFFLLGENLVMRQKKGISIGGHLSSALAIMLANYAEHRALSAMTADTSLCANKWDSIGGLRITDDGLILVAVNKYWADKNIVAANIYIKYIC